MTTEAEITKNTPSEITAGSASGTNHSSSNNGNNNPLSTTTAATTKKKFGKNLNKLTAPPTAAPAAQSGSKTNVTTKNGLLLLSTKRPSSGQNAALSSSTAAAASTLTKPLPSLGLHTESHPSTHDALLGVVVGASRLESQQKPDAWGVAEKQQNFNIADLASPVDEKVETSAASNAVLLDEKESFLDSSQPPDTTIDDNHHCEFRTSNWDEYGGRDIPGEQDNDHHYKTLVDVNDKNNNVNQGDYMAKLAREKAHKRRGEEEHRILEQKERATQRLKELDNKIASKKEETQKSLDDVPTEPSTNRGAPRKLYDPNAPGKSYSALAGGSTSPKLESVPVKPDVSSPKNGTNASDPQSFDRGQPVIHLASYEDQDRGENSAAAGQRMLFDPKSGSMVAVTSRDDNASSTKTRKERVKKSKNPREKESKREAFSAVDGPVDAKGGRRGKNNRKDESSIPSRIKNGGEGAANLKAETRKGKIISSRKFPRTCGVLYSRDRKGSLYCVDSCDGDLGYGVHSVPGGKVKNATAYSKYVERQKQSKKHDTSRQLRSSKGSHQEPTLSQRTGHRTAEAKDHKHGWIKPNEKIELITGVEESPTLQATAREWAPTHAAYAISDNKGTAFSIGGSIDDYVNEDDEDDEAPLGLGFDPTLNMDSVMQSPSMDPTDGLSAVDLAALSLEPALGGPTNSSHIFAFESGATWGTSNAGGSNDWGVPSNTAFGNTGEKKNNGSTPASFLTLSSGSTWGGFAASLNGEKSSGD